MIRDKWKTFKVWLDMIYRNSFKKMPVKRDWMRLEAGDIAGCRVPYLVHYDYHRYFWNASSGKDKAKIMSHIILN